MIRVNVITRLVSSTITGSQWSNSLRLWIHIKSVISISFHFSHLNTVSQYCEIYTFAIPPHTLWINNTAHPWKSIHKLRTLKRCWFDLFHLIITQCTQNHIISLLRSRRYIFPICISHQQFGFLKFQIKMSSSTLPGRNVMMELSVFGRSSKSVITCAEPCRV